MYILKAALIVAAVAHGTAAEARRETYDAAIVRTTYGIPHITARSWGSAGYGVGYAYAQDNLCMIAEEFATVAGERSLHFGPKGTAVLGFGPVDNLTSDIYFRAVVDLSKLHAGVARMDPRSRALFTGYVAGYNRLLRDLGPAGVPAGCRGKSWVRPIGIDDMLRLNEKQMILAGSLAFAPFVAGAAPPKAKSAALVPGSDPLPKQGETARYGSNGWAFGGDVTRDGRGLLVGNPHFPWEGPSRFWQMHVTIPGQYDAMGASIAGAPIVTLGFNRDIAWTHTVTAAQHFTLFELKLDPQDPMAYLVDGKRERMRATTVSVPMPDGAAPVQRTLYTTRYGPVVVSPFIGAVWNGERAFALRDANAGNQRSLATWIDIGRARNVADVRRTVEASLAIPWVNTIVADRSGNAMLADMTGVPGVSAAKIAACATPTGAKLAGRLVLLDGSRAACDWTRTPGTAVPGLMPARDQAVLVRRDYVANSNDSYWLTNPRAPIAALSPILGPHGTERSLRTRSGLLEIQRQFDSSGGKIDAATARSMILASKSLAAEMTVDPLVGMCRSASDLNEACDILSRWDRRFDLDSRGAYLFATFWETARAMPGLWAVPFDANDAVNTPRTLATTSDNAAKLLAALRDAVAKVRKDGIALDARWGDVQFAVRGADHIPIHGANGSLGVLNMQRSKAVPGGLVPEHGSSYIQVVSFDANGPVADAMLSYSQSTDPASPHYADQTRAFSAKQWHRLPFSAAEVEREKVGAVVRISE
ncbi:penicillin acylase family protein [Sphingomonas sp. SUN039]|uniref:penicillin acylase family protein n=1 Tax=Sphingomonas sp. SUN039 TaxID=2937787 RepID=UPI00216411AC|nr:penicillin acylase family protein [Sphingomonas sp. SUN039]UVO54171.1 penicillin acylase family protein [Sphingomonas sp. SUN039]